MRTRYLSLMILLSMLLSTSVRAIVVIAAELPPYVIRTEQGQPSGIAVEILEEAARRMQEPLTIELMPLARAINEVQYRKDVLLIPPVRSAQREHLFYWITPLLDDEFVIVSDRRRSPAPLMVHDLLTRKVGSLRSHRLPNIC